MRSRSKRRHLFLVPLSRGLLTVNLQSLLSLQNACLDSSSYSILLSSIFYLNWQLIRFNVFQKYFQPYLETGNIHLLLQKSSQDAEERTFFFPQSNGSCLGV